MNTKRLIALCLPLAVAALGMQAEVTLPSIITDGMVVQRDQPLKLWGLADPGEQVKVSVVKGKSATATAGADGRWSVQLPPLKTGKVYTINIADKTISDVLVGDVFFCTGQSNMELPVSRVTDMFGKETAEFRSDAIRQFKVPRRADFHTKCFTTEPAEWTLVDDANAMQFTALGYFLAKEVNARTGLPVGIINTCWGGTPVEAWVAEEYLPEYNQTQKRMYDDDAYRREIDRVSAENSRRWNALAYATDKGRQGAEPWSAYATDDADWTAVNLPDDRSWGWDGQNAVAGVHWLRKSVDVPAGLAGADDATLRLGCLVDADSVWVNGTFVGTTSYQYPPRIYRLPKGLLKEGRNTVAVRLISNGGTPHFVQEKPYKIISAATGQQVSLEGEWKYRLGTRMPSRPGGGVTWHYLPAVLYNAMIEPVIDYSSAGVVWYQGESNVGRSNKYAELLTTLVNTWRERADAPGMPFYIVELADFLHPSDKGGRAAWARMRQIQAETADGLERVVLIPNSDLGEWNDIHPLDKKTLAGRIADRLVK